MRRENRGSAWLLSVLLSATLAACPENGDGGGTDVEAPPDALTDAVADVPPAGDVQPGDTPADTTVPPWTTTQTVGPEGATIEGPAGFRLILMPGSLAEDTEITISTTTDFLDPEFVELRHPVIELTPHGLTFQQPALIEWDYVESELPLFVDEQVLWIHTAAGAGEAFAELNADVEGLQLDAYCMEVEAAFCGRWQTCGLPGAALCSTAVSGACPIAMETLQGGSSAQQTLVSMLGGACLDGLADYPCAELGGGALQSLQEFLGSCIDMDSYQPDTLGLDTEQDRVRLPLQHFSQVGLGGPDPTKNYNWDPDYQGNPAIQGADDWGKDACDYAPLMADCEGGIDGWPCLPTTWDWATETFAGTWYVNDIYWSWNSGVEDVPNCPDIIPFAGMVHIESFMDAQSWGGACAPEQVCRQHFAATWSFNNEEFTVMTQGSESGCIPYPCAGDPVGSVPLVEPECLLYDDWPCTIAGQGGSIPAQQAPWDYQQMCEVLCQGQPDCPATGCEHCAGLTNPEWDESLFSFDPPCDNQPKQYDIVFGLQDDGTGSISGRLRTRCGPQVDEAGGKTCVEVVWEVWADLSRTPPEEHKDPVRIRLRQFEEPKQELGQVRVAFMAEQCEDDGSGKCKEPDNGKRSTEYAYEDVEKVAFFVIELEDDDLTTDTLSVTVDVVTEDASGKSTESRPSMELTRSPGENTFKTQIPYAVVSSWHWWQALDTAGDDVQDFDLLKGEDDGQLVITYSAGNGDDHIYSVPIRGMRVPLRFYVIDPSNAPTDASEKPSDISAVLAEFDHAQVQQMVDDMSIIFAQCGVLFELDHYSVEQVDVVPRCFTASSEQAGCVKDCGAIVDRPECEEFYQSLHANCLDLPGATGYVESCPAVNDANYAGAGLCVEQAQGLFDSCYLDYLLGMYPMVPPTFGVFVTPSRNKLFAYGTSYPPEQALQYPPVYGSILLGGHQNYDYFVDDHANLQMVNADTYVATHEVGHGLNLAHCTNTDPDNDAVDVRCTGTQHLHNLMYKTNHPEPQPTVDVYLFQFQCEALRKSVIGLAGLN